MLRAGSAPVYLAPAPAITTRGASVPFPRCLPGWARFPDLLHRVVMIVSLAPLPASDAPWRACQQWRDSP